MPAPLTLEVIGEREIRIVRVLEAPRELVFACYTRPEMIKRWMLGPPGWTMPHCEMDARPGGRYRYVWRGPNGEDMAMSGVIREIDPPSRIVSAEIFDQDWTGGEATTSVTFTEADGKTTLTMVVRYASKAAMDGALATGMTEGMEMGFKSLDALLAQELQS